MKKIAIIGVYFGEFPKYIDLWEKSCEYNETIDFIIFTDQNRKSNVKNIRYIKISMSEFSELASKKLELDIKLKKAYKCCDLKVVYGVIFEDYIRDYEFWGHCDFDLIFGDIKTFITEDMMKEYDKILPLGHLSLYKNTKKNNERYKDFGSKVGDYKEVFTSNQSYAFDEIGGIYSIYKHNNYPFYDKRIFADISCIYKRFRLALKDKNYKRQVFYWENGKVYRAYEENNKIEKEEYIYIHFKKRKKMNVNIENVEYAEGFFIANEGFYSKKEGIPTKEQIDKYNKYNGTIYELLELIIYKIKDVHTRIKKKLNKRFMRR